MSLAIEGDHNSRVLWRSRTEVECFAIAVMPLTVLPSGFISRIGVVGLGGRRRGKIVQQTRWLSPNFRLQCHQIAPNAGDLLGVCCWCVLSIITQHACYKARLRGKLIIGASRILYYQSTIYDDGVALAASRGIPHGRMSNSNE